jgi:hypothetical protein
MVPFDAVEDILDDGLVELSVLLGKVVHDLRFGDESTTVEVNQFKFIGDLLIAVC